MKTENEIMAIVEEVHIDMGHHEWFFLDRKGDGYLLQLRYFEADIDTGKDEIQHARKWYISPHATESEIVRTCLMACLASAEHRVREHFLYRGKRVFGPHIDVAELAALPMKLESREPMPAESSIELPFDGDSE